MNTLPMSVKNGVLVAVDKAGMVGMGVVVDVDGNSFKVREPSACFSGANYIVVTIETDKAKSHDINYSKFATEAGLTAINCTAAVVAGLVTFGSGAASPFSGGTSLAITVVSYSATLATGSACAVSAVRTINSLTRPEINDKWDNSPAYQTTMTVLDGVSLLGVGASLTAAGKVLKIMKNAGVTLRATTKQGVNRSARKRLTQETVKYNRPGATNKEIKQLLYGKNKVKIMDQASISQGAVKTLKDSFAASLSFLASALDGNVKNVVFYMVRLEA